MTDTNTQELRAHLAARLMETAGNLRRDGVMPEAETARTFLTTGCAIAACLYGPGAAAEWVRDLADTIERGEKGLNGSLQ